MTARHRISSSFLTAGLLIGTTALAAVNVGCKSTEQTIAQEQERKAWSSQWAWAYIKKQNNPAKLAMLKLTLPQVATMVQASNDNFNKNLDLASSSQLPRGGVGGLLESIRKNVAAAIRSEEQYLQGGGSGLILLGELTGPDGRPLELSNSGKVEIETFMGSLLQAEGLGDRWSYLSMTPAEAQAKFRNAGAGGGNAVQNGGREFVYNTENLLVLNLSIDAEPNKTEHRVDYRGVGGVASPATRTSSSIEGAKVTYYYQPFMGEWIIDKEEQRRRSNEPGGSTAYSGG